MEGVTALDWVAAIGGTVTALAAVVAVAVAVRLEGRVLDIEEERRGDERYRAKSAYITAEVEHRTVHRFDKPERDRYLRLRNIGDAKALDVSVEVLDDSGAPAQAFRRASQEGPVAAMDPGGTFLFMLLPTMNDEPLINVTARWRDDTGERSNYVQLTWI